MLARSAAPLIARRAHRGPFVFGLSSARRAASCGGSYAGCAAFPITRTLDAINLHPLSVAKSYSTKSLFRSCLGYFGIWGNSSLSATSCANDHPSELERRVRGHARGRFIDGMISGWCP